ALQVADRNRRQGTVNYGSRRGPDTAAQVFFGVDVVKGIIDQFLQDADLVAGLAVVSHDIQVPVLIANQQIVFPVAIQVSCSQGQTLPFNAGAKTKVIRLFTREGNESAWAAISPVLH